MIVNGPFTPVSLGRIGVRVEGVDVSEPVAEAAVEQLRCLFDEHGLLVIRGLDLNRETQIELVSAIGRAPVSSRSGVLHMYVSNVEPAAVAPSGRLLFHSDLMWTTNPLTVLSLYGEVVEQGVAPTMFAGTATAYEDMPPALRRRISGLEAVNVIDARRGSAADDDTVVHPVFENPQQATHPVVYQHPRTDRPLLSINEQQTLRIEGLDEQASEALIGEITGFIYADGNVVEHRWQQGDLLVWDNLAVQHGRPNVEERGPVRTLRRVTCGQLRDRDKAGAVTYDQPV
jgi:alpha-ketoglutarate-dependent taurine dioxygenase